MIDQGCPQRCTIRDFAFKNTRNIRRVLFCVRFVSCNSERGWERALVEVCEVNSCCWGVTIEPSTGQSQSQSTGSVLIIQGNGEAGAAGPSRLPSCAQVAVLPNCVSLAHEERPFEVVRIAGQFS